VIARLHRLDRARTFFPQQHPTGIDAGAFHTDVLAVGGGAFLMFHEFAFLEHAALVAELRGVLGDELVVVRATQRELPAARAVAAYPFNSQVLSRPDGSTAIVAPEDAREDASARAFLERAVAACPPRSAIHYVDVRQSMRNGGGPACLRLRVPLTGDESAALGARVVLDDALHDTLAAWVDRHYRDRLVGDDLADPLLVREGMSALDELTRIMRLGSVYDFQR